MSSLERLGDAISRAQDATLAAHVDRARAKLDRPAPRARRRWVPVLAVACVIAAVLGVRAWRSEPSAITFQIGERPGIARAPIEARADLPLHFSDDTTVVLRASARGVVEQITRGGARVRVLAGHVAVAVPARASAAWTFDVGPFEIAVGGTRFEASWDETKRVFELVMHDGTGKVTGPTIDGGRVVVAGESLRIPLQVETAVLLEDTPPPPVEPPPPAPIAPVPAPPRTPPAPRPPSWQALAADGDFTAALAAVGDRFDAVSTTASASDVTLLGDAARYAGKLGQAQRAYHAVRRRFPGPAAATATFALARLAFDAPDDVMARKWLELYLHENPDGPLAREALGRLLEVHVRTHADGAAQTTARAYLDAYPSGPHAKLARSVIVQ